MTFHLPRAPTATPVLISGRKNPGSRRFVSTHYPKKKPQNPFPRHFPPLPPTSPSAARPPPRRSPMTPSYSSGPVAPAGRRAATFAGASVFLSRNLVAPEVFDTVHDALRLNGAEVLLCADPSRTGPQDFHVISSSSHVRTPHPCLLSYFPCSSLRESDRRFGFPNP